ncbi:hypothetical protein [Pontibacter sp. 13R65]
MIILIVSVFLRPNGFFLVLGAIISCAVYIIKKSNLRLTINQLLFPLAMVLAILGYGATEAFEVYSPLQYLLQGQVLQGYNAFTIPIEAPPLIESQSVFRQMLTVFFNQPFNYFKLILMRFLLFWAQIRPYYSFSHNACIILFFVPVYVAAIYGFWKTRLNPKYLFLSVVIVLQTVMAIAVAVDWDNRFIVPILPFVFIFASIGFNSYFRFTNATKDI